MTGYSLFQGGFIQNIENLLTTFRKIIFFRVIEPNSSKLGTKHPWMEGEQVCSNEGPCTLFSKEKFWQNSKFQQNLLNFISKPQDHFDGRE